MQLGTLVVCPGQISNSDFGCRLLSETYEPDQLKNNSFLESTSNLIEVRRTSMDYACRPAKIYYKCTIVSIIACINVTHDDV